MSSNDNLKTTNFNVVAHRRLTFLRTDLVILIEQSLTGVVDGIVYNAFRFEVRYSEMRDFRNKICHYLRKLYRNDVVPALPELQLTSPPEQIDEILRTIEAIFLLIHQRKYLVESPIFKSFMHHKQRINVKGGLEKAENSEWGNDNSTAMSSNEVPILQPQDAASALANKYGPNVSPKDYLIEASAVLIGARRHESERNYREAYEMYMLAIQTLLEGVKADQSGDQESIAAVKEKIARLLDVADTLFESHVKHEALSAAANPSVAESDFAMAELQELFGSFKITGVKGKIVILEQKDSSGKIHAVKILRKSTKSGSGDNPSTPSDNQSTIMPTDIDRMVRLCSLHETEMNVLLLLEYVPGGQTLFDHLGFRDCYPPSLVDNPTPLDPAASILNRSDMRHNRQASAGELLRRRWSLNLSSSDWNSPHRQNRQILNQQVPNATGRHLSSASSTAVHVTDEIDTEDGDDDVLQFDANRSTGDFMQVLTKANENAASSQFSIDASASFASTPFASASSSVGEHTVPSTVTTGGEESVAFSSPPDEADGENAKQMIIKPNVTLPSTDDVRRWSLQLLDALVALHRYGFVWGDLNPNNILYDSTDNGIRLTFVCRWNGVETTAPNDDAIRNGYVAPELIGPFALELNVASDYWSLGAFMFNLLTGCSLGSCLAGDIMTSNSSSLFLDREISNIIKQQLKQRWGQQSGKNLDESTTSVAYGDLSIKAAAGLLELLLKKNMSERLTAPDQIRTHAFFTTT